MPRYPKPTERRCPACGCCSSLFYYHRLLARFRCRCGVWLQQVLLSGPFGPFSYKIVDLTKRQQKVLKEAAAR